jgi:hypothetical protein
VSGTIHIVVRSNSQNAHLSSGAQSAFLRLAGDSGCLGGGVMRKALLWIGALLCAIGLAVIATSAVMSYMGLNPSYNLGDPAKFEFILVPFWQIGLVIAGIGAVGVLASRKTPSAT